MENASSALTISAGVLIGILVLSFGTLMFNRFAQFGEDTVFSSRKLQEINEFNEPFVALYNTVNTFDTASGTRTEHTQNKISFADVLTVINYAKEQNDKYESTKIDFKLNGQNLNHYFQINGEYSANLNNLINNLWILNSEQSVLNVRVIDVGYDVEGYINRYEISVEMI